MARYYVSPEKWVERDAQNFDALNNTIINKSRRQDYRRSAHGSCLNMLVILAAENLKRQDDIGTWASAECRKILDAGLLAPDTVGFDNFRNAYESVNRSKTKPDDEQALCLLYISAVKDLRTGQQPRRAQVRRRPVRRQEHGQDDRAPLADIRQGGDQGRGHGTRSRSPRRRSQ